MRKYLLATAATAMVVSLQHGAALAGDITPGKALDMEQGGKSD